MSQAADSKATIERLLDALPESDLVAVQAFVEFLHARAGHQVSDPILREFLAAPEDDEAWDAAEGAAIDEGHNEVVRGDVVPWHEAVARLTGSD